MLYLRTPIARLVGDSDIAHAVPLTLIADVLRSNRDPAGWQRVRASLVRQADLVADNGRCRLTAVLYGGVGRKRCGGRWEFSLDGYAGDPVPRD
jgi:hypothetical protein